MPLDYSALVAKWLAETDTDDLIDVVVHEVTIRGTVAQELLYRALMEIPAVAKIAQGDR